MVHRRGLDHDDEEYVSAVPTADPTDPPAIDEVADGDGMEQPEELGSHGNMWPHLCDLRECPAPGGFLRGFRLAARDRHLLDGGNLVLVHGGAAGGTFEPALLQVFAWDHGREFPARWTERIGLAGARLAQLEARGRSVRYSHDAIGADDLAAFAAKLIAEGAEVLVADAAGRDGYGGIALSVVIVDLHRLVDAAGGTSDGLVGRLVSVHGCSSGWVNHSHMNALKEPRGKQNLERKERKKGRKNSQAVGQVGNTDSPGFSAGAKPQGQ